MNNLNLKLLAKIADIKNEKIQDKEQQKYTMETYLQQNTLPKDKNDWVNGNVILHSIHKRKKY